MKNNFKIIDSHCHIYPNRIAEKASQNISEFYDGMQVQYKGKLECLIKHGTEAGVDHFVVQAVATAPAQVTSINQFIAEAMIENRLTGLGTLHPDSETIEEDIQLIKNLGLKGVKLHADIQKIAIDDRRCYKIYEILEGNLPILMHTGDNRYNYSNPENLIPVLETFKNLTVIGAHFGGWSVWEEAAEKLTKYENFYVDTSSTFGFAGIDFVKNLLPKYDLNRILFGTDYPTWDFESELTALFSLNLSDENLHNILAETSAKIYGIFL